MRLSSVKVAAFVTFLLLLSYVFFINFENWYFALTSIPLFLVCYSIALRLSKKLYGEKFRKFLHGWGEAVDPKVALAVEPFIRGVVIYDGEKIFTRIGADDSGIYLYKQGCYSVRLHWNSLRITAVDGTNDSVVRVISSSHDQSQFLMSWSETLNK